MNPNEQMMAAIEKGEVVEFLYPSRDRPGKPFLRTFSPWEISDDVTVIGFDHDREGIRRFALEKVANEVKPSERDESYVQPQQ